MHKYCMMKLPTGERVHKGDHFHDKRCTLCWHTVEDDDDHILHVTKGGGIGTKLPYKSKG